MIKIKSISNQKIAFFVFVFNVLCISGCNDGAKEIKQKAATSKEIKKDSLQINIDPVKILPGIFKVLLENEHVRVVQYILKPGEKDDWHTHPPKSSYVVSGGKLKVHLENGETIDADEEAGTASWMGYAGKHYVENVGKTTVVIVYTEIKKCL